MAKKSQKNADQQIGYQHLMKAQGGVGFAQQLAFILVEMQIAADSILIYNLPYLLLYPQLKCQMNGAELHPGSADHEKYCKADYICKNKQRITYEVDREHPHTLNNWIDSFDLFCASNFEISIMAMNFFIGQTIMFMFIPKLQDHFGRKKVFMVASIINFYTLIGIWGLPDHSDKKHGDTSKMILNGLFLVNGLVTPGRVITGYTYFQEFYPADSQAFAGTLQMFVEGGIYIVLTYFWMKLNFSWRWTIVFAAVMNFIGILLTGLMLPESPKWLYENKQYQKCIEAFRTMAELNNVREFRPPQDSYQILEQQDLENEDEAESTQNKENKSSDQSVVSQFLGNFTTLVNLFAMITVWLSASFCYYLISYQLKYIKGDIFVNGITSSVSEMMAICMSGIFLSYLGLKQTLAISYIIAFTGMFCLLMLQTQDQMMLSVFIIGSKFGVSQVFNLAYIGNIQLFPTSLLATSYGVCNLFARGATILAPYIAELKPDSISQLVFLGVIGFSFMASLFIQIPQQAGTTHSKNAAAGKLD